MPKPFKIKDSPPIKRLRIINMIDCLQQVKSLLTKNAYHANGKQFICHTVEDTDCGFMAKQDTKSLVFKSLGEHYTFQCWMAAKHQRDFGPVEIMTLRRKWIDQLITFLHKENEKLS